MALFIYLFIYYHSLNANANPNHNRNFLHFSTVVVDGGCPRYMFRGW